MGKLVKPQLPNTNAKRAAKSTKRIIVAMETTLSTIHSQKDATAPSGNREQFQVDQSRKPKNKYAAPAFCGNCGREGTYNRGSR